MSAAKPISCAVEQRCIIKFLAKEQVKPIEIYKRLLIQFGDVCLAKSNVYTWIERFKNGRKSVMDDERNHMQANAVTPQNIIRAEKLIKTNPRISVRDLASDMGISVGSIHNILRKKLKLTKLDDRWVQLENKEKNVKQELVDKKKNCNCSKKSQSRRKSPNYKRQTSAKSSKIEPPAPPSTPLPTSTTTTEEKQTQPLTLTNDNEIINEN